MTIFDNQHITLLNKPNGYSVQGGDNIQKNLFTMLSQQYSKDLIHIAHRLDKPTSGIVIITKHQKAAQIVQMAIERRE